MPKQIQQLHELFLIYSGDVSIKPSDQTSQPSPRLATKDEMSLMEAHFKEMAAKNGGDFFGIMMSHGGEIVIKVIIPKNKAGDLAIDIHKLKDQTLSTSTSANDDRPIQWPKFKRVLSM